MFPEHLGDETTGLNSEFTLHSTLQMLDNNVRVYDMPLLQGGRQQIVINNQAFNLQISDGHVKLPSRRYSIDKWEHLDRIIVTGDRPWNPKRYVEAPCQAHPLMIGQLVGPILYLVTRDIIHGSVDLKESYTDYVDGVPSLTQ